MASSGLLKPFARGGWSTECPCRPPELIHSKSTIRCRYNLAHSLVLREALCMPALHKIMSALAIAFTFTQCIGQMVVSLSGFMPPGTHTAILPFDMGSSTLSASTWFASITFGCFGDDAESLDFAFSKSWRSNSLEFADLG